MAKSRKVSIPKGLEKILNISENAVNEKMQEIVDRRSMLETSKMFEENSIVHDYLELFSKEELLAMFMNAASNAGFLEHKLMELMYAADVSPELFRKVMDADIPTEEEVAAAYKNNPENQQTEDEDFI